jgi:TonB-dependent siderophore receptor
MRATGLSVLLSILVTGLASSAEVDAAISKSTNIVAQPLQSALESLARDRGFQLVYRTGVMANLRTGGATGNFTLDEALRRLLENSGLTYRYVDSRTITIMRERELRARDVTGSAAADEGTLAAPASASAEQRPSLRLAADESSAADEDATSLDQAGVDEVVVTAKRKFRPETSNAASKFELPIIETPQALTVLSSEFLEIARLNDTASIVAYVPGVELRGMGDGTQPNLSARGFNVNRERGFRINGLSTDSEIDLDHFAMDRVEVVRGPASSLYGEADYGATFNRVLKAPTGRFGAMTSVEVGSHELRRIQADVQGPIGGSGIVSARATAAVQDSGTFIDHTEDDRILLSPSLSVDLSRTRILVQGYYQRLTGATSDGFPLIFDGTEYRLPRQSRSNNYGADINSIHSENRFAFASVDHALDETLSLKLKAGYSRIDMDNQSSYLYGAGADGISPLFLFPEIKTKEDLSFDLSLEKRLDFGGREQRLLVSADWRKNDFHNPVPYAEYSPGNIDIFAGGPLTVPGPVPTGGRIEGEFFSSKQRFSGITALAHLKATDRLALQLGMRYSEVNSSILDYLPTVYAYENAASGLKDSDWVPRAAAIYKLKEGHNLYLSYSEGIIFNQTFVNANGSPVEPEQGDQYELGFKGELFDRRLMYSAAFFRLTRTNVAGGVFLPGAPPLYYNVGKQVHEGGELEVIGEPIPGLNIVASYSNLGIDVRESANPLEVGNRPLAAPAHSYALFATYEILEGPLRSLTLGGGIVSRSEREVNTIGTYQLPGYTRVDLRAAYNLNDATLLEFNLQNVTDERVYTSAYGGADFGIAYAYPRTAFGRISYRW